MSRTTYPEAASAANATQGRRPDPVAKARELVSLLRVEAAYTEERGSLSEESEAALREAGFFALFAPRRLGGYEADLHTAVDVFAELARGCAASGWVAMLLSGGSYFVSLLGGQAALDVWEQDPGAAVCEASAPTGSARPVADGVVVSGRWQPVSGIRQARWAMVGVLTFDEDGQVVDQGMALIPLADGTIEHTWHVAGMQGTGSETFVVQEVFVPAHRVLSLPKVMAGYYAASHADEPLYTATLSSFSVLAVAAPVLGMAEAALEHTRKLLADGKAIGGSTYQDAAQSPTVQLNLADSASKIDGARLHILRGVADVERAVAEGAPLDEGARARVRMDVAAAVGSARDAVRLLVNIGGTGGFALDRPVQRIWRDLEVASRHYMLNTDLSREIYGRALLGIEPQVTHMV